MEPGDLRHRVEVQELVQTQNSFGEMEGTYHTLASRWCAIEPLTSKELFAAMQVQSNVSHKVRMRYLAGLRPKMRFKMGTRIFNIDGRWNPSEQGGSTEMVVMVKEEV